MKMKFSHRDMNDPRWKKRGKRGHDDDDPIMHNTTYIGKTQNPDIINESIGECSEGMSSDLSDGSYDRDASPEQLAAKKRATARSKSLKSKMSLGGTKRDKTGDIL